MFPFLGFKASYFTQHCIKLIFTGSRKISLANRAPADGFIGSLFAKRKVRVALYLVE